MLKYLLRCYRFASHPAAHAERPLHLVYFMFVAGESHGYYGIVAGCCAMVMFLTIGEGE